MSRLAHLRSQKESGLNTSVTSAEICHFTSENFFKIMNLGLKERTAFIAGASAGLGLAVVKALGTEGCNVAFCSRNRQHLDDALNQILKTTNVEKRRLLPLICDVREENQIRETLRRTVDSFGTLNILVTNAGGPPAGFIDDFDGDQWRDAIELNLMSTINLTRLALPYLRNATAEERPLARILMITSISAKQPVPNLYLSNTARAGVQGFAKSLAEELGSEGINVNTILPGFTKTERLGGLAESIRERTGQSLESVEAGWASMNALKRIADPSEFAAVAAFLVSERASYITGTALPVDGGYIKSLL